MDFPNCGRAFAAFRFVAFPWHLAANQLTRDMDVVALFKVASSLNATTEENQRQKLPMRYRFALCVVLPTLCQPGPYKFTIAHPVNGGFVGEIACLLSDVRAH